QWKADALAGFFTSDPAVIASAVVFLSYLSWNFIPTGVLVTCSSLFQAMGNTWPSLGASALRIVIFAIPTVWMVGEPWFELRHAYTLSVVTVLAQTAVAWFWLAAEFRKRLDAGGMTSRAQAAQ